MFRSFQDWLSSYPRAASRRSGRRPARRDLRLENLETRVVPAGGPLTVRITEIQTGQQVTIVDNDAADTNRTVPPRLPHSIHPPRFVDATARIVGDVPITNGRSSSLPCTGS